jgi:hypothetical protein
MRILERGPRRLKPSQSDYNDLRRSYSHFARKYANLSNDEAQNNYQALVSVWEYFSAKHSDILACLSGRLSYHPDTIIMIFLDFCEEAEIPAGNIIIKAGKNRFIEYQKIMTHRDKK